MTLHNVGEIDSLSKRQFSVQIKQLAIKKRLQCKDNLILVPDSIIKRGCKADVYSLGFLMLHLLLSIDLFHASDSQLQRLKPEIIDLSPQLLDLLSKMFSGNFTINDVMEHPYFIPDDSKFGVEPINEVTPVQVHYDRKSFGGII